MRILAEEMQAMALDRPAFDKTGLMGTFDFDLVWRPDPMLSGIADASAPAEVNLPDISRPFGNSWG